MKPKPPEDYIDYREVRPGFAVSLDVAPNGHAVIEVLVGNLGTAWEYHNIVAAHAAWNIWNPLSNVEPQGYARRHDASSKQIVEVL